MEKKMPTPGNLKTSTLDRLEAGGREGRAAHLLSRMAMMIPEQIRVIREQRKWSQTRLGKEADKPPNVVSRAEDPAYGRFTLKTLMEFATAFDVGTGGTAVLILSGDVNGDGLPDIVAVNTAGAAAGPATLGVLLNSTPIVACPWDLDDSGDVGITDFLQLLAEWGNPYGITDFLDLLAAWGTCP